MKAQYCKLPEHLHEAVLVREDIISAFNSEWHYHDENELVYIIKGKGTRFIGDNISYFLDGDLLLLGGHLPHIWKIEYQHSKDSQKKIVHAIIVQFPIDLGGNGFLEMSEMASIKGLLEDSKLGIDFTLPEKSKVKKQLIKMISQSPLDRLLTLLSILKDLSEIDNRKVLSSVPFAEYYQNQKSERIDNIYDFILKNFNKEIELNKLASIAHMTPTSLCRFFKQSTRKSLSEFINEVRIGYSCKLLIDGDLSISEVCFSCGYNNLSYFNRQFRKIIGKSPSLYQSQVNLP